MSFTAGRALLSNDCRHVVHTYVPL